MLNDIIVNSEHVPCSTVVQGHWNQSSTVGYVFKSLRLGPVTVGPDTTMNTDFWDWNVRVAPSRSVQLQGLVRATLAVRLGGVTVSPSMAKFILYYTTSRFSAAATALRLPQCRRLLFSATTSPFHISALVRYMPTLFFAHGQLNLFSCYQSCCTYTFHTSLLILIPAPVFVVRSRGSIV